jgi:hypothetical protein
MRLSVVARNCSSSSFSLARLAGSASIGEAAEPGGGTCFFAAVAPGDAAGRGAAGCWAGAVSVTALVCWADFCAVGFLAVDFFGAGFFAGAVFGAGVTASLSGAGAGDVVLAAPSGTCGLASVWASPDAVGSSKVAAMSEERRSILVGLFRAY